ncbi:MAG TPA: hypothetical protein VF503_07885 [Sphingobium sp.]|uniref:hypothetical protein n=1 Tax=Sphingobium sp. TaxID=1912891 RepID=UPI002ED2033C
MNPIERAARAMHESAQPQWPWDDPDCEPLRRIYREAARAMILSLREPTDAMRSAGSELTRFVSAEESDEAYRGDAANIWRFMIDAALEENVTPENEHQPR